jgi:hypothetical protein
MGLVLKSVGLPITALLQFAPGGFTGGNVTGVDPEPQESKRIDPTRIVACPRELRFAV